MYDIIRRGCVARVKSVRREALKAVPDKLKYSASANKW